MVLPKTISPLQSDFLPRDINDSVLIAHEILTTFSEKGTKGDYMAIELDMENTYDRLEWEFSKKCFIDIGFNEK